MTTPIATVSALAAVTLFMLASLMTVTTTAGHDQLASAPVAAAANG